MTTHELKCWPEFFLRILTGEKTFEARKDDRGFRGGDMLRIREWKRDGEVYTGREVTVEVTYLLAGPMFGVQPGWAVMGFTPPALTLARVEAERERDRVRDALKRLLAVPVLARVWEEVKIVGGPDPISELGKRIIAARAALGAEPGDAAAGVRYAPMLPVDAEADARMDRLRARQPAPKARPLTPKGEP